MRKVLLATLGDSPAVVTEAVDRLKVEGIEISEVTVLTTRAADAQMSLELLMGHIPEYYQGKVQFDGPANARIIQSYHDVDCERVAVEFLQEACQVLRSYRDRGWEVHASIAGGRKTMSVLLALAVQFYGAASLFHVLVSDPELERSGHISRLVNWPWAELNRHLHPPVEQITIVRLPFVGLFPFIGEIVSGLSGADVPREIRQLLEHNGLWARGKRTALGEMVLQVLEYVEAMPEPRSGQCEIHLDRKGHSKEAEDTRKWACRLGRRFAFIREIRDIGWRQGKRKKGVQLGAVPILRVFVPGSRVRSIGFQLTTTAKSEGQLRRAAQQIERMLQQL